MESFAEEAEKNKLILKLNIREEDKDKLLFTDRALLRKSLAQLLANALKFTKEGEVEMGLTAGKEWIEISVKDTGIGIPGEYSDRIFEEFYQVDYDLDKMNEGAGLGLSIADGYINLLGGSIRLKSEEGKGSVFTVKLKRKLSEEEIALNGKDRMGGKDINILLAEDNDSNYELIRNYLKGNNATIVRAINGQDAIEKFKNEELLFDYVLMDLHMPVMDGLEAAKQIRSLDPDIGIIAQSAYAMEKDKAYTCGCNGFISKPFTKNQLLESLNLKNNKTLG